MEQKKVRVTKSWFDLDWRFRIGDVMEVYDDEQSDYYWICVWGWRIVPKNHCEVIESGESGESGESCVSLHTAGRKLRVDSPGF